MARRKKIRAKKRFFVFCLILFIVVILCVAGIAKLLSGGESENTGNQEHNSAIDQQTQENAPPEIPVVTSEDGTPALSAAVIPGTEYLYESARIIANPESYTCIVNRSYNLPSDYVPSDLVKVSVPFAPRMEEVKYMREDASKALSQMFDAAMEEGGYALYGASGYRSFKLQQSLFNTNVGRKGSIEQANLVSALPGQSEHQLGLAMDITSESMGYSLTEDFYNTPEGKWVTDNCYRFGFIIRYPADKTDITGYLYEPWHCRYVGTELAKQLYESGQTLEEYYGLA